jgi:hypothetical protein
MNLSPITTRKESKIAFDALRSCLIAGSKEIRHKVGWPGGHGEFNLHWHEDARFWVVFGVEERSRYWCAYGRMDPKLHSSVDITCEINPPTKGTDRRCGGVLLKDSGSGLYLAHSGKVGGGRKGVGKTNFLKGYSETHPVVALGARPSVEQIDWPNGGTREVVLLGKIGDRSFVNNLADYIRAVGEFKANATGQTPAAISEKNPDLTFVPEFEGPRKKYKLTN